MRRVFLTLITHKRLRYYITYDNFWQNWRIQIYHTVFNFFFLNFLEKFPLQKITFFRKRSPAKK